MSAIFSPTQPSTDALTLPLCIDLDGMLIRSDTLYEDFCTLAASPHALLSLRMLLQGHAAFKQSVAAQALIDPALLPYNETLLSYRRARRPLDGILCWQPLRTRGRHARLPIILVSSTR
jgi:hypothetical protein